MDNNITREEIIFTARQWIGTPYRHQASLKGVGCDCLGLLRGVFREINGLPGDPESTPAYQPNWYEHSSRDELLFAAERHLIKTEPRLLKPGNVLIFRMRTTASAKHCSIVTGEDTMIHAYSGKSVFEVNMGYWWKSKIAAEFQFPGVID